jgi:cytidine deaminase
MSIEKALILTMIAAAIDQRSKAYSPYSQFAVGAVVMGGSGKIYHGANVENASFGLTVCAERVAVLRAVSDGEREIKAVVVCAGEAEPAPPCGACLQVIAEFSPKDEPTTIVTCAPSGSYTVHTLDDYLPMPFGSQ